MASDKEFKVKFSKEFTLETNSLKCHYHNVRVVAAIKHAVVHGLISAARKYKYTNVDSLRKAAIKKLGVHYPFSTKAKITAAILKKALVMRETMTVKAVSDYFGVSQTHLGKQLAIAKNKNSDILLQQILCNKL